MGGTTLGAIAIAESDYRNLSGRIIQAFTDEFTFPFRVFWKNEDVMKNHLAMSGQVVDVPVDGLLALTVALQPLGKPRLARPA